MDRGLTRPARDDMGRYLTVPEFLGALQSGRYSHSYAAATQVQARSVVFPRPFLAIPNVVVGVADERFTFAAKNVTTTGFDVVTSYTLGAAGAGFAMGVSWIAVAP